MKWSDGWPFDVTDDSNDDRLGWRLRHAPQHVSVAEMLSAAAILDAYRALVDPDISMKDATDFLRRARAARRTLGRMTR